MAGSVRFGVFEFDPDRCELRKHGLRIRVPGQSLEILAALVDRPGEIVTRERIRRLLWPRGTVVEFDQSISAAVKRLREAIGDPAARPRFIERVPRRGYRFIGPVEALPPPPSTLPEAHAGAALLHYKLVEKVGTGSMGEVWRADDTKLGRTVALKLLPERLAEDADALEAFRAEARHAAALNDPNICAIYGLEEDNGRWFLVMEYIDGIPLSAALSGEPLPTDRVLEIGAQAVAALAAAHKAGIIHRQPPADDRWKDKADRLRHCESGASRRCGVSRQPPPVAYWNAGVHVSRTGPRRTSGCPIGPVLARRCPL